MATIILTGGGTAGHCTPHLALLPYLKKNFDNICYIGSETGIEKQIIEQENIPYFSVACAKLNRKFTAKNLKIPFILVKGITQAGNILDQLKPCVIFSKGGYVALPTVIAAKKRKIPVIAHESDYTVGLANKISSKYCEKVLTSFPDTADSLKNGKYVGSPIRINVSKINKRKALDDFSFSGDKPILLVTGGSTGAKTINKVIRESLNELTPKYDVLHICGKNNLDTTIQNKSYFQTEYMHDIERAFSVADICVSRAGSNALFELLSIKKPCLLIPLPKGISRGDQVVNAEYFEKLGLVSVLQQNSLTTESLVHHVNSVYANRFNLAKNFEKNPVNDKSEIIADILCDYLPQK